MSWDIKARDLWKGGENEAVSFLLKPVSLLDVEQFWVYVEQWKNKLALKKNVQHFPIRSKI